MSLRDRSAGLPRFVQAQAEEPPPGISLPNPDLFAAVVQLWVGLEDAREFEVVGESMAPILEGLQRIRARMGDRNPRFGDVVLFYRRGNLIGHRVVGRRRGLFLTRGDSGRGFDPLLDPKDLVGVVTHLMWHGRIVDLEGFGGRLLRFTLGLLSWSAGAVRLSPLGRRRSSLVARVRDGLGVPIYTGSLLVSFRVFAAVSRLAHRLDRLVLRREDKLLLAALRPVAEVRPGERTGLEALTEPSWLRLQRRAIRLGSGPRLLDGLRRAELLDSAPAQVAKDLERAYYGHALYNTVVLQELGRILVPLNRAGIIPVVLKGAALAGRLYENVALRSFSDLDLLVLPEEVEAADVVLRGLEYSQTFDPAVDYTVHHHKAPYVPPRGHPRVEIHTGLVHPGHGIPLDLEGMRRRSREVQYGEGTAHVMCPEDQLVHAAVHLSVSDGFVRGVKDLTDIDLLVRRNGGLDWGRIRDAGEAPGLGRVLYYALHLARRTFGTPLDPVTWAELRRQRLPVPEDRLLKRIALHCLTALPGSEEFFGMSTAKWMATVLLTEQRRPRRLGRIARRFVWSERRVPSETSD